MKVKLFFKRLTSKYLTGILSVLLLVAIIPVTMKLVGENQDIRNRAAQNSPHLRISNVNIRIGDTVVVTVGAIPSNTTFASAQLAIDPQYWEVLSNFTTIKITNAVIFKNGIYTPSAQNNSVNLGLIVGAHNINTPLSGDLFEVRIRALKAGSNIPLILTLKTTDTNALASYNNTENATINIQPANNPVTPIVTAIPTTITATGPVNSISAPSQPELVNLNSAYRLTVSLNANPRPTTDGQGKAVKLVFLDSTITPNRDRFDQSSATTSMPTLINTYSTEFSLNRTGQQIKWWAIYHNDPRKSDGWSDPVSTGIITFSVPTPTTARHACVNSLPNCINITDNCSSHQKSDDPDGTCGQGFKCCLGSNNNTPTPTNIPPTPTLIPNTPTPTTAPSIPISTQSATPHP